MRGLLLNKLDTTLGSMLIGNRFFLKLNRKNLIKSLGLDPKTILHQVKAHPVYAAELDGFVKTHDKVKRYSQFLKGAGYGVVALDAGQSVMNIKKACLTGREEECAKSKFSEGGRFIGSVGGGAFGGLVGYGACNLLFSVPSGGTSLLWCGIVLGGLSGYGFSQAGGKLVEGWGEVLYENTYRY